MADIDAVTEIGEDYRDAVCADETWVDRHFLRCDFTEADLHGLRTQGCTFTDCTFVRTDLGESSHASTALRTCTVQRASLGGSSWHRCSLLGSAIVDCRIRPVTVADSDLTLAGLGGADLRGTDLSRLRLREADLRHADLSGARLLRTRLDGADLRGTVLDADGLVQASLRGARVDTETALAFAAAHGLRWGAE